MCNNTIGGLPHISHTIASKFSTESKLYDVLSFYTMDTGDTTQSGHCTRWTLDTKWTLHYKALMMQSVLSLELLNLSLLEIFAKQNKGDKIRFSLILFRVRSHQT